MGSVLDTTPVGFDIWSVLSGLLLIPYLLWGVYLLRHRLSVTAEIGPRVEAATLGALVIFFMFEFSLLKAWLGNDPLRLILASLGLIGSGMALYGPMAVSFSSYVFTELLMPRGYWASDEPRYGVAEGLEQIGDFEGAAREYIALGNMFPKQARAALRAGDNLMKVGREEAAAEWFERGIANLNSPDEALPVVNRLAELYSRKLERPEDARRVLEAYVERYPDGEYAESVRARVQRLGGAPGAEKPGPDSDAEPGKQAEEERKPEPDGLSYLDMSDEDEESPDGPGDGEDAE
ncbi:MAG: hypothetical protein JXR94_00380 [Candidatus Hydrogenedentes bacterium]|nr:hypothetical protein [Candidatus Hydrogenedentota bacterium]